MENVHPSSYCPRSFVERLGLIDDNYMVNFRSPLLHKAIASREVLYIRDIDDIHRHDAIVKLDLHEEDNMVLVRQDRLLYTMEFKHGNLFFRITTMQGLHLIYNDDKMLEDFLCLRNEPDRQKAVENSLSCLATILQEPPKKFSASWANDFFFRQKQLLDNILLKMQLQDQLPVQENHARRLKI